MIKTLKNLLKQDKERYTVPRKVQDVIPVRRIWKDGIFQVGGRFSKTYQFTDINYLVASREDKEQMFLAYSELLNSLDSGATTKITINNRRLNRANFEQSILMPMRGDACDVYRREYNQMLLDKATGANGIIQEKYITVSVCKKDIEEARTYFARIGADLIAHFAALGSKCTELDAAEKLRVLHDFYRQGEEAAFHFDPQDMMRKGHNFKDYICPDSMEKSSDCLKLGEKYCRVLFLKDYASYIKDSMVTELTDFNRNMMLSIDVVPIPTDEAVREVENRLLGIETNITNWQRRQNANNNFSAVVPYDMELQRKESKEFLDDLTTRDQRMMLALSDNCVIYGHHMNNGTMFADLCKYESEDFYQEHKTIRFDTLSGFGEYEIVAVFKTVAYSEQGFKYYHFTRAESAEDFDAYITQCKALSLYDTGVTAEYDDKLITLSTCEYSRKNGRMVVVAKRIAAPSAEVGSDEA